MASGGPTEIDAFITAGLDDLRALVDALNEAAWHRRVLVTMLRAYLRAYGTGG
jgi:hypothetical protein